MRIGLLTTSFPRADDDIAGAFVLGFARTLAARGHEIEVLGSFSFARLRVTDPKRGNQADGTARAGRRPAPARWTDSARSMAPVFPTTVRTRFAGGGARPFAVLSGARRINRAGVVRAHYDASSRTGASPARFAGGLLGWRRVTRATSRTSPCCTPPTCTCSTEAARTRMDCAAGLARSCGPRFGSVSCKRIAHACSSACPPPRARRSPGASSHVSPMGVDGSRAAPPHEREAARAELSVSWFAALALGRLVSIEAPGCRHPRPAPRPRPSRCSSRAKAPSSAPLAGPRPHACRSDVRFLG